MDQIAFVIQLLMANHMFAHVNQHLKAVHRTVAASAQQVMNVPQTEHVSTTNAKTHALALAELTRNVTYVCTALCALVMRAILEIRLQLVI